MSSPSPRPKPTAGTHKKSGHAADGRRAGWTVASLDPRRSLQVRVSIAIVAVVAGAYFSRTVWLPYARQLWSTATIDSATSRHDVTPATDTEHDHPHEGHDHEQADDGAFIELSDTARQNIGLRLVTVERRPYDRTITIPGVIKERPGRTLIKVSAPMTGIVTRVYPLRGEAVTPGQPLFDIRLTHEDLVQVQTEFLQTVEQLDVIKREIERLEDITSTGAIAGKTLLERRYEQQQAEARLRAERQALILHGLTPQQVDEIQKTRQLLQRVTVPAPEPAEPFIPAENELLQVAKIEVSPGQHVQAGDLLCEIGDYCVLYIEGRAFEEDSAPLNRATNANVPVTALIDAGGGESFIVSDLRILYLENEVELDSRALRFYVRLPNEIVRNEQTTDGHRFVGWRFKPGQRVQVRVPIERWEDSLVLPVNALVTEGAESFVFVQCGNGFERREVHVAYRDPMCAVLEDNGALSVGDSVVANGAYQLHLALKNKLGGAVDPHAGHNH